MAMSDQDGTDGALDPIEAEVERDRAELVSTVEALRRRITTTSDGRARPLSADALRSEVGRYATERRQGMTSGLERRVRAHPLETVALAVVGAYPIVRMVTRIPPPILLMGAGVALASRGGGGERTASGVVVEGEAVSVETAALVGGPRVSTLVDDTAQGGMSGGAATSAGGASGAGILEGATQLYRQGVDTVTQTARTGIETVTRSGRAGLGTVARSGRAGGETLVEAIQRRPAAAAGVGLLLGGALAMMLPRSRAEERLFGEASEEVRARARALASEGIESGRKVIEAARAEAADQGLSAEGARRALDEVGTRAKETLDDIKDDASKAMASGDGSKTGESAE